MTDEKEARRPVTHVLKTDPAPFSDLLVGDKNSEVRQADRDYQVGDRLALRETTLSAQERGFLRVEAQYTGRELIRTITHIQRGYGLPDGIAVLSLSLLPPSAQPAAPTDEPRLNAPAQVGNVRFSKGTRHSLVIQAAQRHHAYMNTPEREAERIAHGNVLMDRLRAEIGLADKLPSMSAHHVEQLLRDTVPGGSVCDPQQVADSIRAWFGQRVAPAPSASPAALTVTDGMAMAFYMALNRDPKPPRYEIAEIKVGLRAALIEASPGAPQPSAKALTDDAQQEWRIRVAGPAGYERFENFKGATLEDALEDVSRRCLAWVAGEDGDPIVEAAPAPSASPAALVERFERIKRLALDAGGQGALSVPQSLRKIVRECLDGVALLAAPQPSAKALTDERVEATAAIIAAHLLGQPQRDDVEWVSHLIRAMLAAAPAAPQPSAKALTDEQIEQAAAAMHAARREFARKNGFSDFDVEFDALPDDIKGVDRALARAALLAVEQPSEDKRDAAARTLERLGYTYHGAELWEPPIGSTATQLPRHALEAWRAVVRERRRQIAEEGWTPEHDDEHQAGDLARAGACYALHGGDDAGFLDFPPPQWPWAAPYWKPGTQRRNLVKAGALILAELERDIRATIAKGDGT